MVKCWCGMDGSLIVRRRGDRQYYYVRHTVRTEQGSSRVEHYIGPVDGYVAVEMVHSRSTGALSLTNVIDTDYKRVALNAVINLSSAARRRALAAGSPEEARAVYERAAEALEEVARAAREEAERLRLDAQGFRFREVVEE